MAPRIEGEPPAYLPACCFARMIAATFSFSLANSVPDMVFLCFCNDSQHLLV